MCMSTYKTYSHGYFEANCQRERQDLKVSDPQVVTRTDGWDWNPSKTWSTPFIAEHRLKYMRDVPKPFGTGVWQYQPCYKRDVVLLETPVGFDHPCDGTDGHFHPHGIYPVLTEYNLRPPVTASVVNVDIPVEARNRMIGRIEARLPSLRPGVDLVVFLTELGDIANTLEFLSEKSAALMAASAHLTYNFGVAPLLPDITGVARQCVSLSRGMKSLRQGIGKVHDFSTTFSWDDDLIVKDYGMHRYTYQCGAEPCLNVYTYETGQHTLTAYIKYRYSWPEALSSIEQKLAVMLTKAGLFPNIDTVWEKIPFSFVLDWIFNTKQLFKSFCLDQLGFDIITDIVDACLVHKSIRTMRWDWYHRVGGHNGTAGLYTDTIMERWCGDQVFNTLSWWFKLPSFMQLSLGAALVGMLTH